MLSGLLLSALVGAVLATVGLFVRGPRSRGGGLWRWTERFTFALVGTAVLAVLGGVVVRAAGYTTGVAQVAVATTVLASIVWLPLTRRWNSRAHLCWSTNIALFVIYLVFMLHWTVVTPLGVAGTVGASLLLVLEVFAALLAAAYLWELCDALGREHWVRRHSTGLVPGDGEDVRHPFVSLHVPAYEEPPEMVIATLSSLQQLDYDNYEIVAIDDNTRDEALWRPVQAWCAEHGVKFAHLQDWPGYKSGALNTRSGS